jgi:hypothetical protein
MPLRFVLDEHLRGILWGAFQRHNRTSLYPVDVVGVGDPTDLPLGTTDPDLLRWVEKENRVLISRDKGTLSGFLQTHLSGGQHCPGILILRPNARVADIVFTAALMADSSSPSELRDCLTYIPP